MVCRLVALLAITGLGLAASDDQTNVPINYGTFQNPSALVRPRFRYWLPDSSVDPSVVKADIESAAALGAGGIELVPFFLYGGQSFGSQPAGANWSTANFGTPEFQRVFVAALQAHADNGLQMDFAMGPNQGQGVPAHPDDEGLQWDLRPFVVDIGTNGSFDGVIPGWGTGELVALTSAEVVSKKMVVDISLQYGIEPINITYDQYVLKHDTLTDHSASISVSGDVSLSLSPTGGSTFVLFAFYQYLTGHKNLAFNSTQDTTIFDNGSYIVDHYSGRGAQATIDFWEKYVLTEEATALLKEAGNYGWEDSIEMTSNISWSRSMASRFERVAGHSIKPFLPLLTFGENNINIQSTSPGSYKCLLDTPDQGAGVIHDFHATLTDGYTEDVSTFVNWTNTLGLQYSAQPSYNLPMDMLAAVPYVDAPECESLGFSDNVDSYRAFSGPAQLAGKRVVSNEMGAVIMAAYKLRIPQLLYSCNRAFAGGVNRVMLHGLTFSGDYYGTTWPGYTTFGMLFSEMWGVHQPAWEHGLADAMEYLARMQRVLQMGTPRVDLAVYLKQNETIVGVDSTSTFANVEDLLQAGWTYSYLSPDNFNLAQAVVKNGVLAPDGPAWKAMWVPESSNLTMAAVDKLAEFANAGLPVVISGTPGYYASGNGTAPADFEAKLSAMMKAKNVHVITEGQGAAGVLSSLGLSPRAAPKTNSTTVTTVWRDGTDSTDDTDYLFVFSDSAIATGEIVVQTTKRPYLFNPWTGDISHVLVYEQTSSTTTIPLSLAANQTVLLGFSNNPSSSIPTPPSHLTSAPSDLAGCTYKPSSSGLTLQMTVSTGSITTVTTSSGKTVSINSTLATAVPPSFPLADWTLTAEHWTAPSNLSSAATIAVKTNTTHKLTSPLVSWTAIPALVNISGVGYYASTFSWPPPPSSSSSAVAAPGTKLGAFLDLPPVGHLARLYVNGVRMPAVDIWAPRTDVSAYLRRGANEVLVEVPTVLWNYLRTMLGELQTAGVAPALLEIAEYFGTVVLAGVEAGLVGEVRVVPFVEVPVDL